MKYDDDESKNKKECRIKLMNHCYTVRYYDTGLLKKCSRQLPATFLKIMRL